MSGWLGELESVRGDRGHEENKNGRMDFGGGVTLTSADLAQSWSGLS